MANEPRPPQQDRLPIKLIMPKQGAERKILPWRYSAETVSDR
jgi:hypothetical protein